MLNFQNLNKLNKHLQYLYPKVNKNNLFIVGGAIRDIILGISDDSLDIDITTSGDPKDIFEMIDKSDISIFKTDKFGTITIIPKDHKDLKYEITPLRTESEYDDFRHPNEIRRTDDLIQDSFRRDFTINSIYYNYVQDDINIENKGETNIKDQEKFIKILEENGSIFLSNQKTLIIQNHDIISKIYPKSMLDNNAFMIFIKNIEHHHFGLDNNISGIQIIIDPNKGIQDLLTRKLKAVGEPDKRFQEDALRLVRAVRIVNIINQKIEYKNAGKCFDYETNTRKSLKKNYYLIENIAKERIHEEIVKVFTYNNPFGFIALIDELNMLKYIFPALWKTKGVNQPIRYHPFDVYSHTILCLWNLQQINKNYILKLGMIYHDIGKPDQYYHASIGLNDEERKKAHGSYIHHTNIGTDMAIKELKELGYSNSEIDEITFYIKYHMFPGELLGANEENLPKKLTKLMSQYCYEWVDNLFDLAISDRLGQFNPLQSPDIEGIQSLKKILKDLYESQGEFKIKDMKIKGNDIIEYFKIQAGPKVGELINIAFEWVIENVQSRNDKQLILKFLQEKI